MKDELKAELLPCPFCGAEALLDSECSGIRTISWAVDCSDCGASVGTSTSKKHIIELWNTRAQLEGWVSVEDRLPIDEGKILISYGEPFFGEFSPETECGYYEDGVWKFWLSDKEISTNGVTHWMPLPKPPEQESK